MVPKIKRILYRIVEIGLLYLFPVITLLVLIILSGADLDSNYDLFIQFILSFCSTITTISLSILYLKVNEDKNKKLIFRKIAYVVVSISFYFIIYFLLKNYSVKNLIFSILFLIGSFIISIFSTLDYLKVMGLVIEMDDKDKKAIEAMHTTNKDGDWNL